MNIEFKKISEFKPGILFEMLKDAYSFDSRYEQTCSDDWYEFDNFFFNNLEIADKYGFITTLNNKTIGFISWDPRKMPEYAQIGHNCIISKYKNKGYGKIQLQEVVNRIKNNDLQKIIVTTNDDLIPAQKMYESVGFKIKQKKKLDNQEGFIKEHIDYEYLM